MNRPPLPGVVASVTGPKATSAACETARERVISAAVAYVSALRDWEERGGYAPSRRQLLHCAQAELVAAVEGWVSHDLSHKSLRNWRRAW